MANSAELTPARMSNQQMTYEIVIDQDFKFVDDNYSAPYNTRYPMTVSVHKKF